MPLAARHGSQGAGPNCWPNESTACLVRLGTDEEEASKPGAQEETGWPGGESMEPDSLGSSQIKSAHCLLAVSCALCDQGRYDTPSESLP